MMAENWSFNNLANLNKLVAIVINKFSFCEHSACFQLVESLKAYFLPIKPHYRYIYLLIYGSTVLCWTLAVFQFLNPIHSCREHAVA
jgi:hypothetical protein